jgi:hypothetical protein
MLFPDSGTVPESKKINQSINNMKPKLGQLIKVRGIICHIVKIHPFGTVDVLEVNGSRAFRVTGLSF